MSLNNSVEPFKLRPTSKDSLWGGKRLIDEFNKNFDVFPLAELWECSTYPHMESIVDSGEFKNMKLTEVLNTHPEYIGTHPKIINNQIPVLVKFIDANKDLSIQVHPDDEYAKIHEKGSLGKTEMWYVVDASKDASIIYGFHHEVTKQQIKEAIKNGDLEKYMNKIHVKPQEVYFIPSGLVHAICKGCLIIEIQQSSDLTYRLYDYNRIDKTNQLRTLHIDKGLDVANLKPVEKPHQRLNVYNFKQGRISQLLARCKYFQVERFIINTQKGKETASFKTDSSSFQILLCYRGCGSIININTGNTITFNQGDCIFIPANSDELKIYGQSEFINVRC